MIPPLIRQQPSPNVEAQHIAIQSRPQRKSNGLVEKAKSKVGKWAIQVAEEELVKKLGALSPKSESSNTDLFEQFAQHFDQPLTKVRMEAIQVLLRTESNRKRKRLQNPEKRQSSMPTRWSEHLLLLSH